VAHGLSGGELTDGVEASVGTQLIVHQRVVVTDSTIVELLCPV
jgi:hypothetical protein